MDFSTISSVNSYVKSIELKQKWQKKKEENNLAPQSQFEFWAEEQRKQAQGIPGTASKNKNMSMDAIQTKIANGKNLTYEEEEYLRQTSPVTLQHYKAAKAERDAYERDLKRCKTKDEVERLKTAHISSSLATINSVRNNPDIPKGDKYAILMVENQKMNAIAKITAKFVQSGEYADLPTEEEKRRAEQALKDAQTEQTADNVEAAQTPSEVSDAENPEAAENAPSVKPDDTHTGENDDMTVVEAYNTPEMQKLKRARARAAYAKAQDSADSADTGNKIDVSI